MSAETVSKNLPQIGTVVDRTVIGRSVVGWAVVCVDHSRCQSYKKLVDFEQLLCLQIAPLPQLFLVLFCLFFHTAIKINFARRLTSWWPRLQPVWWKSARNEAIPIPACPTSGGPSKKEKIIIFGKRVNGWRFGNVITRFYKRNDFIGLAAGQGWEWPSVWKSIRIFFELWSNKP
jgi:hypothetical protein